MKKERAKPRHARVELRGGEIDAILRRAQLPIKSRTDPAAIQTALVNFLVKPPPSTARARIARRRRSLGLRSISVLVSEELIDSLVKLEWLSPQERSSRPAIQTALSRYLYSSLVERYSMMQWAIAARQQRASKPREVPHDNPKKSAPQARDRPAQGACAWPGGQTTLRLRLTSPETCEKQKAGRVRTVDCRRKRVENFGAKSGVLGQVLVLGLTREQPVTRRPVTSGERLGSEGGLEGRWEAVRVAETRNRHCHWSIAHVLPW